MLSNISSDPVQWKEHIEARYYLRGNNPLGPHGGDLPM